MRLNTPKQQRQALSPQQLAQRWNVDIKTIYREISRSKLPAFKMGRSWRITLETIEKIETNGEI